ncbi:hypothetical protein [Nonomuraea longispora]|nr:hypothetical protein [Nonomuraea longispora]
MRPYRGTYERTKPLSSRGGGRRRRSTTALPGEAAQAWTALDGGIEDSIQ